jgi:hypothetical protein
VDIEIDPIKRDDVIETLCEVFKFNGWHMC